MLAVNISPEIERRIGIVANATGRTPADIIEEALAEGLSDREAISIAEARLDDIYSGKAQTLSHEELFVNGMDS